MSLIGKDLTIHTTKPFDLSRRLTAHATHRSWKSAPHATYLYEPDITSFYEYYVKKRETIEQGERVTFTVVMLKAIAESLKKAPKLNGIIHYNNTTSTGAHHHLKEISISIPWVLPDSRLILPVIHEVGEKNLREIAHSMEEVRRKIQNTNLDVLQFLVAKKEVFYLLKQLKFGILTHVIPMFVGRQKANITRKDIKQYNEIPDNDKLLPRDILDGSVLVSNLGSIFRQQRGGITLLDLITPQVFAIAINAIQERPHIYCEKGEKKIGIRKILPLSLTIDHRALDGADFIPFQDALDSIFANPTTLDSW